MNNPSSRHSKTNQPSPGLELSIAGMRDSRYSGASRASGVPGKKGDKRRGSIMQAAPPVFNIVDPNVKQQQNEWENLLYMDGPAQAIPFAREEIFGEVTEKHKCAAIWLQDALHARAVDYPRSDQELKRFIWGRSPIVRNVFNIAAMYQIISPFLGRSACRYDENPVSGWSWFEHGGTPSITGLAVIDILCLLVFSLDLFLTLGVNFKNKSLLAKPWTLLRLVGTVLLFCGIISTISGYYTLQLFLRCIAPFFMISRRNNLKLMLQGLLHASYYTRRVLVALAGIIVMWGLVGFFIFREEQEFNALFDTPSTAIFTALHLFTARPFMLLALNDVFKGNSFSTLYFVSLTLSADILCTAFIIAVGNRQYKLFAKKVLRKRLIDRKNAISLIYFAFADAEVDGRGVGLGFPMEAWVKLMAEVTDRRYSMSPEGARNLFYMEDPDITGFVGIDGFYRMIGSICARITFKKGKETAKVRTVSAATALSLVGNQIRMGEEGDEEDEDEDEEEEEEGGTTGTGDGTFLSPGPHNAATGSGGHAPSSYRTKSASMGSLSSSILPFDSIKSATAAAGSTGDNSGGGGMSTSQGSHGTQPSADDSKSTLQLEPTNLVDSSNSNINSNSSSNSNSNSNSNSDNNSNNGSSKNEITLSASASTVASAVFAAVEEEEGEEGGTPRGASARSRGDSNSSNGRSRSPPTSRSRASSVKNRLSDDSGIDIDIGMRQRSLSTTFVVESAKGRQQHADYIAPMVPPMLPTLVSPTPMTSPRSRSSSKSTWVGLDGQVQQRRSSHSNAIATAADAGSVPNSQQRRGSSGPMSSAKRRGSMGMGAAVVSTPGIVFAGEKEGPTSVSSSKSRSRTLPHLEGGVGSHSAPNSAHSTSEVVSAAAAGVVTNPMLQYDAGLPARLPVYSGAGMAVDISALPLGDEFQTPPSAGHSRSNSSTTPTTAATAAAHEGAEGGGGMTGSGSGSGSGSGGGGGSGRDYIPQDWETGETDTMRYSLQADHMFHDSERRMQSDGTQLAGKELIRREAHPEVSSDDHEAEEYQMQFNKYSRVMGAALATLTLRFRSSLRSFFGMSIIMKVPERNPIVALLAYEQTTEEQKRRKAVYVVPLYNTVWLAASHVTLVAWLCRASNPRLTYKHMTLGWFLQSIFMLDMILKYFVYGYRGLGKSQFVRYVDVSINVCSLIAMIILQDDINSSPGGDLTAQYLDPALLAMLLFQSTRIFKLFFVFNDQNIFEYILPTVLRAIFLLFSVIYFFSIFAHGFFCNSLCSTCDNVVYADDDSSNWPQFNNILNFNSLSMTLFTMFEMVLLSNWSIVMDAVAKVEGWKAYLFFYIFRLVMTLVVLPILVSFMMNSFISGVVREDQRRQVIQSEEETHRKYQQALELDFDADVGVVEERQALGSASLRDDGDIRVVNGDANLSDDEEDSEGEEGGDRDSSDSESPGGGGGGRGEASASLSSTRRSSMSNWGAALSAVMPSVAFSSDVDALDGRHKNYDIQSKPSSSKPSMMQIWSGEEHNQTPSSHSKEIAANKSLASQFDQASPMRGTVGGNVDPAGRYEGSMGRSSNTNNDVTMNWEGHARASFRLSSFRQSSANAGTGNSVNDQAAAAHQQALIDAAVEGSQ